MTNSARTSIIWSERYRLHDTGDHPECPERIDALDRALKAAGIFDDRTVYEPTPAEVDAITAVHAPALLERVQRTALNGGAWMDQDTYVSPESFDIALLAAGGAMQAVDQALTGDAPRSFALVRPPGHHAEPNRAMGFCLFNNAAVAARHALDSHGLERIAIVDWDVHHGNGTQAVFWEDPAVLFVSLHQYPYYPGTGARSERGGGRGEGYTLNVPLPAGSGDEIYLAAFDELVVPALNAYEPQLVMISAGFDAHRDDPLAQMRVSTECFGVMAARLQGVAERWCDGRVVLILEGGYNLQALGASVVNVIRALDGDIEAANVDNEER